MLHDFSAPWRMVSVAILIKGLLIATVLNFVLGSSLSLFDQGLIIAAVSASITGIFTVIGALLAVRLQKQTKEEVTEIKEHLKNGKEHSEDTP